MKEEEILSIINGYRLYRDFEITLKDESDIKVGKLENIFVDRIAVPYKWKFIPTNASTAQEREIDLSDIEYITQIFRHNFNKPF